MRNLIVYGSRQDFHLQRMSVCLRKRGIELLFYETTTHELASAEIGASSRVRIGTDSLEPRGAVALDLADCLVWLRNKAHLTVIGNRNQQMTFFRMAERSDFLLGAVSLLKIPHFNDLAATRLHDNKLFQLELARSIGFVIPETLVSNSPDEIRAFVHRVPKAITKPLRTNTLPSSRDGKAPAIRFMTSLVTAGEVDAAADEELLIAPSIYQAYVEKAFEVRLTATSLGIVAYRLNSQESDAAAIDWRRDTYGFSWERLRVPDDIATLVNHYLERAGLTFGAFDFVVKPDGGWVYLECNSEGQWGWLEQGEDRSATDLVADTCVELLRVH